MAALDCKGTPIYIPKLFDLSGIPVDKATRLRLIAPKLPPTGPVTALPDGLNLNENNQIELHLSDSRTSASSYRYSLIDSRLTFPAIHNLTGTLPVAEVCLYFRNQAQNLTGRIVCLCLTLGLGTDEEAPYFNALNASAPVTERPFVTSLFDADDTFIEYVGADLRGRTQTTPNPNAMCDPVMQYVTYMVCTGQGIIGSQTTLTRLTGLAGKVGPVTQTITTLPSDLVKYCSLVYGIRLGQGSDSGIVAPTSTSALKCYRIDPSKDVKDGKITLGGQSKSTLADEIIQTQISQDAALPTAASSGVQPGDLETYIAITIAIIIGIALIVIGLQYFFPGALATVTSGGLAFAGLGGRSPFTPGPTGVGSPPIGGGGGGSWFPSFGARRSPFTPGPTGGGGGGGGPPIGGGGGGLTPPTSGGVPYVTNPLARRRTQVASLFPPGTPPTSGGGGSSSLVSGPPSPPTSGGGGASSSSASGPPTLSTSGGGGGGGGGASSSSAASPPISPSTAASRQQFQHTQRSTSQFNPQRARGSAFSRNPPRRLQISASQGALPPSPPSSLSP